jgi:hypothetical protein
MPILSTDVAVMLSVTTGAAGGSTAGTPAGSLGKYVSTTVMDQGSTLDNLFPDITGAQNAASAVDYRCVFVQNNHGTLSMIGAALWVSSQVPSGADCQVGVDPTAVSAIGASAAQAAQIANGSSAPAGVSFSSAASSGAALALGTIGPGQVKAIWIKRAAANTAALNNDGLTIEIDFDTTA